MKNKRMMKNNTCSKTSIIRMYKYRKIRFRRMNKYKKYAIVWAIATLLLWALSFILINFDVKDRGTYGDMFGPVNALFSGFAFAGLIITLVMQHDELGLQRKELIQTNKELAAQREQFTAQTKTMQIQRFENTLFNMLSLQQGIVNSLYYKSFDGSTINLEYKGKNVFDFFYNLKTTILPYGDDMKYWGIKGLIEENNDVNFYPEVEEISIFDSYFRHLYRIFKYIDESPLIDDTERYDYSSIVRAQLSEYELLVLFYNALTNKDNGVFKFKDLIEKYAIFNNIRVSMLARGREDYKLYNEGAYVHQV